MFDSTAPERPDAAKADLGADWRLVRHLRRAMLSTLAAVAVILGLMLPLGAVLVTDFRSRIDTTQRIEQARDSAEEAAFLASRAVETADGTLRASLLRQLVRARDQLIESHAMLRAGQTSRSAAAQAIFTDNPYGLDRGVASFVHLIDTLIRARDPVLCRMIADRLEEAALYDFRPGFNALQASEAELSARLFGRVALAGGLICLVIVFGIGAQWSLSYRPVAQGLFARTRALIDANEALRRAGLRDGLTGMPNRVALVRAVRTRLAAGQPVHVLHVDLLRFGGVNDTLGRDIGDRLLCHAAAVISAAAGPRDLVFRIDGDDFAILPEVAVGAAPTRALADQVIAALGRPVVIEGHDLTPNAVVGIALVEAMAPAEAETLVQAERVLADAEIALTAAPAQGGCALFTPQMRQRLESRRNIAQELARALERSEIRPYFQPQICATTGQLTGFEALARWIHPSRGVLRPGEFLDIAAGASLSQAINDVIVGQSLACLADWRAQGMAVPTVSVNFAADHLRAAQVLDRLAFDTDRVGLLPSDVVIEVLESALIVDANDPILATVTGLSRAGYRIDIDDFGTGHASFQNLRLLKPNRLKIDRSFVHGMTRDVELRKMTEAMIRLAATLGIDSLAEGVETVEEWALLAHMGCTGLQGYAIGHPMRAEDVVPWARRHQADLAAGRLIRVA